MSAATQNSTVGMVDEPRNDRERDDSSASQRIGIHGLAISGIIVRWIWRALRLN
jgi:hypothetical protein